MEAVLVAAAYSSGSPDAASLPFTATMFFLAGAGGGLLHGVLVGAAGRPPGITLAQAIRAIEAGAVWAIPALIVAWIAALWVSMTSIALELRRPSMLFCVALGWMVVVASGAWALAEARRGIGHAMERWPERRPGGFLVAVTFVVLPAAFVWRRPEIWFTDLRVSAVGAVILAMGATIWLAVPVLILVLHFLHHWRAESPIWEGSHHLHGEDSK
ncbi:MAG: hypothetical protein RQ751_05535 [Longimicrobiales bacterium]|nr:hypothetical protein [Longimicrobiales bacterium]